MALTVTEATLWTALIASSAGQVASDLLDIAAEFHRHPSHTAGQLSTATTSHMRPLVAQEGR